MAEAVEMAEAEMAEAEMAGVEMVEVTVGAGTAPAMERAVHGDGTDERLTPRYIASYGKPARMSSESIKSTLLHRSIPME